MNKLLTVALSAAACFVGSPAFAMTPGDCTNQQSRTLEQIEDHLGKGELNAATAATSYSDAMQTYTFGNYYTGACTVIIRRGRADFVTYTRF